MWGGNYHAVDKRLTRYKCSVLCTLQTCIRTEASPTKRKENAEWSQLAQAVELAEELLELPGLRPPRELARRT